MKTAPRPLELVTVDQLQAGPRYRECELWDGIACVKGPSGGMAPFVSFNLTGALAEYLRQDRVAGWAGNSEVAFLLRRNPDRLLSPDIGFVSAAKMPNPPARGFAEVVPDYCCRSRAAAAREPAARQRRRMR